MINTANSYQDVMKMPIGAFLGIVTQIRIDQLKQNPEWREAYLKHQYLKALKEGKVVKQTKMDLDGLLAFQSSL